MRNNKLVSRRNVLRSTVGISSIYSIGVVSGDDGDDQVTIPIVKSGDEVVKSKQVPREWYDFENVADRIFNRIYNNHGNDEGVYSVAKGSDTRTVADRSVSNVEVYVEPGTRHPEIPSQVEGVNIEIIEETPDPKPDGCNTGTFDPVPGGVQIWNSDLDTFATTTQKVYVNGDSHLLTCAHSNRESCSDDIEGNVRVGNNTLGNVMGGVNDKAMDITTVPDYDVNDYANHIEDGDSPVVNGYVTEAALADFKSMDTTVHKFGFRTCHTSGEVVNDKVMWSPCGSDKPYVTLNTHTEEGDSGAPHYYKWESSGDYYAATIGTHFGDLYGNDSAACAAWKVHDVHGIQYDLN